MKQTLSIFLVVLIFLPIIVVLMVVVGVLDFIDEVRRELFLEKGGDEK